MKCPSETRLRRFTTLFLTFTLLTTSLAPLSLASVRRATADDQVSSQWRQMPGARQGVIVATEDGGTVCRVATKEEQALLARNEVGEELIMLTAPDQQSLQAADGINIILRGTAQLNAFPDAKAGFIRAANTWRSLIKNPVTVVIDVDFGPTRFGRPYPKNVIGSTDPQDLFGTGLYPGVRALLLAGASNAQEKTLYGLLPKDKLPTDFGNTTDMVVPSILLRAIGALPPVFDPAAEPVKVFGNPPSVGFNSAFNFDFDPTDGIGSGKTDFDSTATHEIGHALGFTSYNGLQELEIEAGVKPNQVDVVASVWDLFRLRKGSIPATLLTANRVLLTGVPADFVTLNGGLPQSTGGLAGDRGDFAQSSHWQFEFDNGNFIGIMDPFGIAGLRRSITANDLAALDAFGYDINLAAAATIPSIVSLNARLDGEVLTLTGTANDADTNLSSVQVIYYTKNGSFVGGFTNQFPAASTKSAFTPFSALVPLPGTVATAAKVSVVLLDSQGNTSAGVTADFSKEDLGGPTITSARLTFQRLIINGSGLRGRLQLEVNGKIVTPPVQLQSDDDFDTVRTFGALSGLGLRPGLNRIRINRFGKWSNIFVLNVPK